MRHCCGRWTAILFGPPKAGALSLSSPPVHNFKKKIFPPAPPIRSWFCVGYLHLLLPYTMIPCHFLFTVYFHYHSPYALLPATFGLFTTLYEAFSAVTTLPLSLLLLFQDVYYARWRPSQNIVVTTANKT